MIRRSGFILTFASSYFFMSDYGFMIMCDICGSQMERKGDEIACPRCGYISWPSDQKDDIWIENLDVKKKLDRRDDFILLDVREPEEHDVARIEEAQLIPMKELPARLEELPKDKQIVTYCHTQNRSFHAARFLIQKGIMDVKVMKGGIDAWAEEIDQKMPRY